VTMSDKKLLDEKPLIDSYLKKGARPLSSFSFVSLFAWCDFFDFELKMISDSLCIFAHGDSGTFLYLPPLGIEPDPLTIEHVFRHMAQGGKPRAVNRIENIPGNLLSSFGLDRYNQYLKPAEYVYSKEDLIALKGNAYKSQRHDCNCFSTRHPAYSFETYTDGDFDACMTLYERWSAERSSTNSDEIYCSMLQENKLVHARLLRFWKPLNLIVRVLRVDGTVVGYTLGFVLDEQTFCVYAEIADLKFSGSAAHMFRSFCADPALVQYSRINTMDDFAMPKVAQAKKAYHPSELIKSYVVSIKV